MLTRSLPLPTVPVSPPRKTAVIRKALVDLHADPAMPRWIGDIIPAALDKDPVDAAAAVAQVSFLLLELADATLREQQQP